jgi:hypothetical protein
MTVVPTSRLTTTWERPRFRTVQLSCLWIPYLQKPCEVGVYYIKLLNLGEISFTEIDNLYKPKMKNEN